MAPLVVALHGCSQTADEYDRGTGWSVLADRLGFAVVYPEQQPANNPKNCFSWFLPGDTTRDRGEARLDPADGRARHCDIRSRPAPGVRDRPVGRRRHGFGHAGDLSGGFCRRSHHRRPSLRKRPVRSASVRRHVHGANAFRAMRSAIACARLRTIAGPWPKISIWHGTADPIVKPSNCEDIIRQWTELHGLPPRLHSRNRSAPHAPCVERCQRRRADRGILD